LADEISWHTYFLGMAKYVSQRGTCPTKKVGAILVDPQTKSVLSVGYNGSPRGTAHCGDECLHRDIGQNSKACKAIHAEMNAVLNSAFNGIKVRGAICYVTISPCLSCSRALIQAGVSEIIASGRSPYDKAFDLLKDGGVKVTILSGVSMPRVTISNPINWEA